MASSKTEPGEGLSTLFGGMIATSGALLLLWLAAFGPVIRWAPPESYDTFRVLYAPLLWASHVDGLRGSVNWYAELWEHD